MRANLSRKIWSLKMVSLLKNEKTIFPILKEDGSLRGVSKEIYNTIQKLPSLLILEKFKELTNIQSIALVGSSASGKSTLMKQIRLSYAKSNDICIPMRYITRPQRVNDDLSENSYLSVINFQEQVKKEKLPIYWVRKMEEKRVEYYGFEKTEPQKLAIYSANNDFYRELAKANKITEENSSLQQVKDTEVERKELDEEQLSTYKRLAALSKTLLILGVYAPDEARAKRLSVRSPDLATSEKEYRIGDSSDNIIPHCHVLLRNYDETEKSVLSRCV